jgi:hypothetical protein
MMLLSGVFPPPFLEEKPLVAVLLKAPVPPEAVDDF